MLKRAIKPDDIFIVVGTSLQVVPLQMCVPMERFENNHPLNWQVNPELVYPNSFGVIEIEKAGVGLKNLESGLVELMQ